MKWPDDIGRVAGIGRTVTWDERREFRGSDIGRPAVGWPRAGQNGPAPHAIIIVVVVVVVLVVQPGNLNPYREVSMGHCIVAALF